MAKSGGMGDTLYVDQYDLGGDVGSVNRIGGGPAPSEVTGIKKSGMERIGLLLDGAIDFTSWFNDATTTGAEGAFTVLKALPTTDRIVSYFHGAAVGAPAASLVSKQINYDTTRGQDAALSATVNSQGNGWGLEWGEALTAQSKTDGAASNGTGVDYGAASTLFGWSCYIHLLAFTGTSVTFNVQDSADNVTFATVTAGSSAALTTPGALRLISSTLTATVRRYVRIQTTGTFTNAVYAVNFVRYLNARVS